MARNTDTTRAAGANPALGDPADLIRFCDEVLVTLRRDDGLYCFDRDWSSPELRGVSPRYTLMVALGLERSSRAGYEQSTTAAELADVVLGDTRELTLGDRGLLLWLLTRQGDDRAAAELRRLATVSADDLTKLEGMEVAWLVIGAATAVGAGHPAEPLLDTLLESLWSRRARRSPLFHHAGTGRGRSLLPNFATEIYTVLALAEVARATGSTEATRAAMALADLLVESRDDDFGWPWMFHAERGTVVERHQIYSVHQDAMAPMAYFALAEVTGDERYATAGAEGLAWCFGRNELGFHFYDRANHFAHRAIRKHGVADRAELWINTGAALLGVRGRVDVGSAEVNRTCRPYHLGWILEAWAGREHRVDLLGSPS